MALYNQNDTPYLRYSQDDVLAIWSDCILTVVGWFQVSGVLNPATNKYKPETDSSGNPVSGPGWVAYEKTGASPGDIVIIYTVKTIIHSSSNIVVNQFSSVLWDLLDPGGLSYWTESGAFKSIVSKSDLITQFPHPGDPILPVNPENPNGLPDILWKNVTSQYDLPGPGHPTNNWFIREVLPGFGLRVLVWSDSCCIAANQTMRPIWVPTGPGAPRPPTIPVPGVPGGPGIPIPPPGGGLPPGGGGPLSGALPPSYLGSMPPRYSGQMAASELEQYPVLTWVIPNKVLDPHNQEPDPTIYDSYLYRNLNSQLPAGLSPIPRPSINSPQPSFINSPINNPLPWVNKAGEYDINLSSMARPAGVRYLKLTEAKIPSRFLVDRVVWTMSAPKEVLLGLGVSGHVPTEGKRVYLSGTDLSSAPGGRSGSNLNARKTEVSIRESNYPNVSADPKNLGQLNRHGIPRQTMKGVRIDPPIESSDVSELSSPKIVQAGNSSFSRVKNKRRIISRSNVKQTSKGKVTVDQSGNPAISSLRKRTFDIARSRNATYAASSQKDIMNKAGPSLVDINKVLVAPDVRNIPDPNNQFKISPIVYRGGDNWKYVTIVEGNVTSRKDVVLQQAAYVQGSGGDGMMAANLGSSGAMNFGGGDSSATLPALYAIANPICLPGQSSLPNIIAGGLSWDFMTLVSTLYTLEGNIITQNSMNFLPAAPGDVDVVAPNRLPVGLMRDLELSSTEEFLYDGTCDVLSTDSFTWYEVEPSVLFRRKGGDQKSVTLVLKATTQAMSQANPFRPLMEIYEDATLQSSGPLVGFVGGPCGASPGWYLNGSQRPGGGGVHTACPGMSGYGGAGGTSAYTVDQYGQILTGPYNFGVYPGTHQCFLYFKYDPTQITSSDSTYIQDATNYRLRVYNNGPMSNLNGYVIYGENIEIVPPNANLSIDSGIVSGTIVTNHCCQTIKIVNDRTKRQIERRSDWQDGTVFLNPEAAEESILYAVPGDVIKIYRPGFDNQHGSNSLIGEFTL
jgi:hypothetical protein